MSTSFDNLVARKGSPTNSLRSGSTEASASNRSETRDLSRQTAQQQRHSHRRAIQARKIVFLVLILLLILGGLGYAIYRVVSNDSDEATTTKKLKLDENDKKSVAIETSSMKEMKWETSVLQETVISSNKEKRQFSTEHITSTISTVKKAPGADQITSSVQTAHVSPILHSTISHGSSYTAIKNPTSLSSARKIKFSLDNTGKTTDNVASTSAADKHHSHDFNKKTSIKELRLKMTETSLHQTTKTKPAMQPTASMEPSKSSTVSSYNRQISDTVNAIEAKSSTVETEKVKPSTTKDLNLEATETNIPYLSDSKTVTKGMILTSTITPSSHLIRPTTSDVDTNQISFSINDLNKSSIASRSETSFSTATKVDIARSSTNATSQTQYSTSVTIISENSSPSLIGTDSVPTVLRLQTEEALATIQSTSSIHSQSLITENGSTIIAFSHSVFLSNNIRLTSSPTVTPENGGIYSTVVSSIKSSTWLTSDATTPLNASNSVGLLHSYNITTTSPVLASTSAVVTRITGNGTNSTFGVSDLATATIQPTKASITPVVSSSVTIPPYYLPWSNWTTCTRDCGGGYVHQTRNCSEQGQCAELGPSVNTTICNLHKCNETVFDVSLNLTDFEWSGDLHNTSSQAYLDIVEQLMEQLRALYGPNVTIEVGNISQGSVIISFTITFATPSQINNLTNSINEGKIGNLSVALVKIVNNMVPKEPESIAVRNITTNSTVIQWNSIQANDANGILLGYKVTLTPGNASWTFNNHEANSVNVGNLNPNTEYTVNVFGFNVNGDGAIKTATFKTKELPPYFLSWGEWSNCSRDCGGGVMSRNRSCSKEAMCSHLGDYQEKEFCNVEKCNETSYEVGLNMTNVEWTDDLKNTSSKAYQDLLAKFLEELRKKYPNATIEGIGITKGSVLFSFKITFPKETKTDAESLSNDFEDGLGNFTTEVKKLEDANLPRVPPGSIEITMVTHHSAVINWQAISDEDSNGAILGYKIILIPGINKTIEINMTATASDTEFKYVLQMLASNTTYHFQIYGYNINGEGPKSETMNFTTKVQIPKIVSANISEITTIRALFSWQRIIDSNETYGILTGYKIIIIHQPDHSIVVTALQVKVYLDNLQPNKSYGVKIFGYNHFGDGVISDIFNFTTRVQIPKVSEAKVSTITRTGAVFTWNNIHHSEKTYGKISGYKVVIASCQHGSRNMTVSQNYSSIELNDLHLGTSYNITILGFNEYGDGIISDVLELKTRDMIPKPNLVSVSNITTTSARLSWASIQSNNETYGNIDGYKIVTLRGLMDNNTITGDVTSLVVRNLSSNSTYCFNVLAFNAFGDGLQSDERCFTTLVEEETVISSSSQSHSSSVEQQSSAIASTMTVEIKPSTSVKAWTSSVLRAEETSTIEPSYAMSSVTDMTSSTAMMPRSFSPPMSSHSSHKISLSSTHWPSSSPISSSNSPERSSIDAKSTPNARSSTVKLTSTIKYPVTTPSSETNFPQEGSPSSTNPTKPKTATTSSVSAPEVEYIVGKIRLINETFTSELNNPETEAFKILASKLEKVLVELFRSNGIEVDSVKVIEFSQGSVIFDFYVVTQKSKNYQTANVSLVLQNAKTSGGLQGKEFEFFQSDFSTSQVKPTMAPTIANKANKGLQKNDEEDDDALIVAVVICVLLFLGVALVALYVAKKKNWLQRGKRKVVPQNDDDDDDDEYGSYPSPPTNDKVRLKTARAGRRSHGARINEGNTTTEC